MTTPTLHLQTLFQLDPRGRIVATLEPDPAPGPLFILVRGTHECAWAVHTAVPDGLAAQLERLAQDEPPATDFQTPPLHAAQYRTLLGTQAVGNAGGPSGLTLFDGPAFAFPAVLPTFTGTVPIETVPIENERLLMRHFHGWRTGEIAAGRGPMLAVLVDGHAVSVCFCARRSDVAAEAGLETAAAFRRRGYGARVTAAWAQAVRAGGRTPLYSTAWSNTASRAVARRLGLIPYAGTWSLLAAD